MIARSICQSRVLEVVMRSMRGGIRSVFVADDEHEGSISEETVRIGMRWMGPARRFLLSMVLLSLVFSSVSAVAIEDDFAKCQTAVEKWAASTLDETVKEDKHTLQGLLFFLHIPRTGGRTYFHCFLRKLYASYMECPRSYDKLRFDPSKPNCRLMSTHDDYSIMSRLPREKTSVVTILRSPVDRVFSSYEFSVEVAARFLVHPNLTSATKMTRRVRRKSNGVSTLDIWPWKYLVPWMREDLFARRDARKRGDFMNNNASNDPYDMEEIVMPLHKFINDPIAHDIVHNGATFQVAGLTNNSCYGEAHEVRHCVGKHRALGKYVLDVAKRRLDDMLYVGLTEDHKESASLFSNVVGAQVLSQLQALSSSIGKVANNDTGMSSSIPDSEHDVDQLPNSINDQNASESDSTGNSEAKNETITVEDLMEAYEACVSSSRKAQTNRRTSSLKMIHPAVFSKEARLGVPETILQQIISLNSLDVELYKHAQSIFEQQRTRFMEKLVEVERHRSMLTNLEGAITWKISFLGLTILVFVLIFVLVTRRRITSKLKV